MFVSFQPVTSPEHMPSAGVFCLLQIYAFLRYIHAHVTPKQVSSHYGYAVCSCRPASLCLFSSVSLFVLVSLLYSPSSVSFSSWR